MSKKPIDWEVITGVRVSSDRDETTWSLLDRKADRFDNKSGELLLAGRPYAHLANVATVFRHDPTVAGKLRYDEFAQRVWYKDRKLEDGDDARFVEWLGNTYQLHVSTSLVAEVVTLVAMDAKFHPVRDYMDQIRWDGVERIDSLLPAYFNVRGDPRLVKAYGRKLLIACVARAYKPGCKVDTVLVLFGGQGKFKSTGFEALCGTRDWFADDTLDIGDKDAAMNIQGKLLYEIAELDSFHGRELSSIKAFLSRKIDHFRPPFARRADDFPRQTVFVGSTNDKRFLIDQTGSRRFWPVAVGRADVEAIRRDRDQLWAEALEAFRAGEQWWLTDAEEEARVAEADSFAEFDPWLEQISVWLSKHPAEKPTTAELLDALDVPSQSRSPGMAHRISRCMQQLGWESVRSRLEDGSQFRLWKPIDN